jgi:hypothetical protein
MAYTTRQQLIDRILRFYYDGYPDDQSEISNNEVDLYINDAIATVMNKQAMDEYNITGIMSVPEGYITTYTIPTPSLSDTTGFYNSTLPHPPMGLPGESGVVGVYFGGGWGQSKPILHVKPQEVDYFSFMPMPPQATFYWIENSNIYFWCRTDLTHISDTIYIRMATNVQSSNSATLNIPPDAVELVFQDVIQKLLMRKNIKSDNLVDGKENG